KVVSCLFIAQRWYLQWELVFCSGVPVLLLLGCFSPPGVVRRGGRCRTLGMVFRLVRPAFESL
ncbi:hypothetical protein Zm00014a_000213, partial [Zea mays]